MCWEGNVKRFALVCFVGLSLTACSTPALPPAPQATQPAAAAASPTAGQVASGLTADQPKNMDVQLVANDKHPIVKLTNGEYKAGTAAGDPNYADVKIVPDFIAFGDLNGDGQGDAAFLLAENYGGSGVFVSLIPVLNQDGKPVQAGSVSIDDRPKITGLEIKDGRINFTGNRHGPNDPACCAAQPVLESYALTKAGLVLRQLGSTAPSNEQREITIESPADGVTLPAGPVEVKGSYTVSPFENTLAYHVKDQTGKELLSGSFTTQGEMGKPGTFAGTIDLSSVPSGLQVLIEVSDVSAADGSILAMDSVEVMIQ
jgi:hypothetical protein